MEDKIGQATKSSLSEGFVIKSENSTVESIKLGMPAIVETDRFVYYCIVGDGSNTISREMSKVIGTFVEKKFMEEYSTYPTLQTEPLFTLTCLKKIDKKTGSVFPFDSMSPVPSPCYRMRKEVFEKIYKFNERMEVGHLRDFPEFPISLDLELFVEQSSGIFGTTGSGKSVMSKYLCIKLIENKITQLLLIDPSGEYGYMSPDGVVGLKTLFPNDISLYSLNKKDKKCDHHFKIFKENIILDDILTINSGSLTEVQQNALFIINKSKGKDCIIDAVLNCQNTEINPLTLVAIKTKINALMTFSFIEDRQSLTDKDSLEIIKSEIVDQKKSVVVDLAGYSNKKRATFIITNLLCRMFHDLYREKSESCPRLTMLLEEAHKFIKIPIIAEIACEDRKFKFSLIIIDQIPWRIDSEILSTLNNRIILKLNEERDITSALSGVNDQNKWKSIIRTFPLPKELNPNRSCAFIVGSSVSLPTVIEMKPFFEFIADFKGNSDLELDRNTVKNDKESIL